MTGTILLIDTCGSQGTLALARAEPQPVILATDTFPGRSASELLLPRLNSLAVGQGIALADLAALAVVHGPGSFTGIRIGLSAAKGLCQALDLPLIAISRLALLAGKAPVGEAIALLDAGRGEFYCGHYLVDECLAESLRTRHEVFTLARAEPDAGVIVCEAQLSEALSPLQVRVVPEPTAADALWLAAPRLRQREFDDISSIDANYVRRTPAEIFARPNPARPAS